MAGDDDQPDLAQQQAAHQQAAQQQAAQQQAAQQQQIIVQAPPQQVTIINKTLKIEPFVPSEDEIRNGKLWEEWLLEY